MFKLVGKENFAVGKAKCTISIEAISGFAYEYSLDVNGKSLKKFSDNQNKVMKSWVMSVAGTPTRVALGKRQILPRNQCTMKTFTSFFKLFV